MRAAIQHKYQTILMKIKVIGNHSFQHLYSQMSYDENKNLGLDAYKKPEIKTKYLKNNSCYPQSCKSAIVRGVGKHLAVLTTTTPTNQGNSLYTL